MKKYQYETESRFEKILELNPDIDAAELWVAYHGANRNGSIIPKEAFIDAYKTAAYKPIVAHYLADEDDFGGHDYSDDDNERQGWVTEPLGVVPENSGYRFETLEDEGGVHEYFVIPVYLWKRQRSYQCLKEKGFAKHSMEIEVLEDRDENGSYYIESFRFLAFCLLGEDVEPCFEGSVLKFFDKDKATEEFSKFIELVNEIANQPRNGDDIEIKQKEEEPKVNREEFISMYGLAPEAVNLNEEISDDEFKANVFNLIGNISEELREKVSEEKISSEWGEVNRYCFYDYDLEAREVYVFDRTDWKMYGFEFTFNGDNIQINTESKKKKKIAIVDFDEGTEDNSVAFSFANDIAKETESAITAKYEAEKAESDKAHSDEIVQITSEKDTVISELTTQNEELKQDVATLQAYKDDIEAKFELDEKNSVFEKWEELLSGNEEYTGLREHIGEFTADEIEIKCKCIYADKTAKFTVKKPKSVRISAPSPKIDDGYGGILTANGARNIN